MRAAIAAVVALALAGRAAATPADGGVTDGGGDQPVAVTPLPPVEDFRKLTLEPSGKLTLRCCDVGRPPEPPIPAKVRLGCCRTVRLRVVIPGLALLILGNIAVAGFGVRTDNFEAAIPIVGPLFAWQNVSGTADADKVARYGNAFLLFDFALQNIGAALIVVGSSYLQHVPGVACAQ